MSKFLPEALESRRLFATSVTIGSTKFFARTDADHGTELWKSNTDGSNATLVKDIFAGKKSSSPSSLFNFNSTLYFSAIPDNATGRELFKSDGTANGTVLVKDIRPNGASSDPHAFRKVNNKLLFLERDKGGIDQLYVTDGTSAGTIKLFSTGLILRNLSHFAATDALLYFDGWNGNNIARWQSNGTLAGTRQLTHQISDGVLNVTGTAGTDTIRIENSGGIKLTVNGSVEVYTRLERIIIDAGAGNDTVDGRGATVALDIKGRPGNDTIHGGNANDKIDGGDGDDNLSGEDGKDTILGGSGDDSLFGGDGSDNLNTGGGTNLVRGQGGKDHITAKHADDRDGNSGDVIHLID